ncbi:hypothetical protein ACFL6U_31205 [Planctomycetota bacterium]
MVKFPCKRCGQKLSVEQEQSGTRVKCPKCGSVGVVPGNSDKIKFHCENCGQSISVPQVHAGKQGKCPKCKTAIVVPSPKRDPVESAATGPLVPSNTDEDSYTDEDAYAYEDESDYPEEDESPDRRLILAIGGAVGVVAVGLIILVIFLLRSGSRPAAEPDVPLRQEVADVELQSAPIASDTQPTGTPAWSVSIRSCREVFETSLCFNMTDTKVISFSRPATSLLTVSSFHCC